MIRLLIVSADDLGLTDGINRAVQRAHRDGVVTSTSLLAVGRSFESAVRMLHDTPTLDVGAHLAIVGEDPPLLTAREVPSLVDARGNFPLSYRTVVRRGLVRRIDPDDVRREFGAQLERIRTAGIPVTHLDTHQHTHLWPAVTTALVGLAGDEGIPAVRTPHSATPLPVGFGVNLLERRLRRRLRAVGLVTTDAYAGLDEAGAFDAARLARTLDGLDRAHDNAGAIESSGSVEINFHPGEADDIDLDRFTWRYRWADELDALLSPASRALIERHGYRLGSFRDLNAAPTAADGAG